MRLHEHDSIGQFPLLKPKALVGAQLEYIINGDSILITNTAQIDTQKRKIEIPLAGLSRFISELQEIEKIMDED